MAPGRARRGRSRCLTDGAAARLLAGGGARRRRRVEDRNRQGRRAAAVANRVGSNVIWRSFSGRETSGVDQTAKEIR